MQIPFNADKINLIYQFGEQSKAETCANLSAIFPQVKDSDTKQIINSKIKNAAVSVKNEVLEIIGCVEQNENRQQNRQQTVSKTVSRTKRREEEL